MTLHDHDALAIQLIESAVFYPFPAAQRHNTAAAARNGPSAFTLTQTARCEASEPAVHLSSVASGRQCARKARKARKDFSRAWLYARNQHYRTLMTTQGSVKTGTGGWLGVSQALSFLADSYAGMNRGEEQQ